MKPALFGFVFRRVLGSLRQLLSVHLLTAGTVAMSLYVFGAFVLVEINLQRLLKGWGDEIEVIAYLDKGFDEKRAQELMKRIGSFPEVQSVRLTSREQAWRDFQAALGSQSGVLDGLPRDVLPASLEISLKPAQRHGPAVEQLAGRLKQEKEIAGVEYPQEWVERLGLIVLGVEWAKWILGGALFMTAFIIVGSTVKLAMLARRDEIEVLQLVGASEESIQAPFVVEGMIQGLVGAAISVGLLWLTYHFLRGELPPVSGFLAPLGEPAFLDMKSMAFILALGWSLGAAGSAFSLRRFLRRWKASQGAP